MNFLQEHPQIIRIYGNEADDCQFAMSISLIKYIELQKDRAEEPECSISSKEARLKHIGMCLRRRRRISKRTMKNLGKS